MARECWSSLPNRNAIHEARGRHEIQPPEVRRTSQSSVRNGESDGSDARSSVYGPRGEKALNQCLRNVECGWTYGQFGKIPHQSAGRLRHRSRTCAHQAKTHPQAFANCHRSLLHDDRNAISIFSICLTSAISRSVCRNICAAVGPLLFLSPIRVLCRSSCTKVYWRARSRCTSLDQLAQ